MTIEQFKSLPAEEQQKYRSHRVCPECDAQCVRTGHSTGDLHVVCINCNSCPDCDEGE